jgi:hypothetical protein
MSRGYGADNDTWAMLGTWDVLRAQGRYVPSRFQGYPLAEVAIGSTSELAGHWLSGALSAALGCACIALTYDLVHRRLHDRTNTILFVSVLAATPVFVIAATTSVDYLYGLTCFLAGWVLLERNRSPLAVGVLFGLAAAGRITYLPLGLLVIVLAPGVPRIATPWIKSIGATLFVGIGAYVPALVAAHGSLSSFSADRPTDQGLSGFAARAGLKAVSVLGIVASVILVAGVVFALRTLRAQHTTVGGERWLLAPIALLVAIWVWLPLEPSYLLPVLVLLLVWLSGSGLVAAMRPIMITIVVSLIVFAWADPQLFAYTYQSRYGHGTCAATKATGFTIRPHIIAGPLLSYPHEMDVTAQCNERVRKLQFDR